MSRLTRNTSEDGKGKYSIIEHEKGDRIEDGLPGTENEFIVIKLKDINAEGALFGYAISAAKNGDDELSQEYINLMKRAGSNSPWCKVPD